MTTSQLTKSQLTKSPATQWWQHPWAIRVGVLLLGVLVIPTVIAAIAETSGPFTPNSIIWMAFATAAGQTIGILGAISAFVITLLHRRGVAEIALFTGVVIVTVLLAANTLTAAADIVFVRLGLL